MNRLEFVRSRAKNAGLLVIAILLVAGSLFMARSGEDEIDRAIGWLCAAFFGLALLVSVRNIVRGGTAFAFDPGGITDQANSIVIPWQDVEECVIVSVRGTKFLGLHFRDPDQFLGRFTPGQQKMARLNERMGWGHWTLSFSGLSPGIDAALGYIRQHAPSVRTP
jgi:hypothetical protein